MGTAAATAFDNYYATFVLPKAATVDYSGATLFVRMTDVASLGIDGTRSHSFHIGTGMNGAVNLENWFDLGSFTNGNVSGTIDGKPFAYSLSNVSPADGNYYAILASTDTEQTRAAWQAFSAKIDATTQEEDSYVLIRNGSTIQIGKEKLSFEDGEDLRLDNLNDLSSLQKAIRSHLKLETGVTPGEGQIVIFLKAGTQLAVARGVIVDGGGAEKLGQCARAGLAVRLQAVVHLVAGHDLGGLLAIDAVHRDIAVVQVLQGLLELTHRAAAGADLEHRGLRAHRQAEHQRQRHHACQKLLHRSYLP